MSSLPLLPDFMARGIERFAVRRLLPANKKICLDRRRIYILPSRNGMIFSLVLLVILAGSINYQNSMGYLLTFITLSIMLLGMIATHQNLNHLCITVNHAPPVHAGQSANFSLTLSRARQQNYININLQCSEQAIIAAHLTTPQNNASIEIPVLTIQRGYLTLPRIRVFTEFPLGLFHAWSWIELDARCLIYPAPIDHPPIIETRGLQSGSNNQPQTGEEDFAGIRNYRTGDSPKRMAWKAIARSGIWQTKTFHAESGQDIWFNWRHTPENYHVEKKLSVLCRWLLDAHRQNLHYGLDIPGTRIEPGSGNLHLQQCLRALALFDISVA